MNALTKRSKQAEQANRQADSRKHMYQIASLVLMSIYIYITYYTVLSMIFDTRIGPTPNLAKNSSMCCNRSSNPETLPPDTPPGKPSTLNQKILKRCIDTYRHKVYNERHRWWGECKGIRNESSGLATKKGCHKNITCQLYAKSSVKIV